MTILAAKNLLGAVQQLSGTVTHLVDGQPVTVSLRFTGQTRLTIARFAAILRTALEPVDAAMESIIKQHGGPFRAVGDTGHHEATQDIAALHKQALELPDLPTLPEAEFVADNNPVPPAVLELLLPHLK